jgi:hypothetical protein
LKRILDGWSTSGIYSAQSGLPVTLFAGTIAGISDPLLLGAGNVWLNGDATQLHPSAFASGVLGAGGLSQPLLESQGTSGRNHLRLAGLSDFDISLTKSIRVTEGTNLRLRWEVFNLLNHANLSGFSNTFTQTNFGQYTSTATNMRQMQGSIRFQF